MQLLLWLRKILSKNKPKGHGPLTLPLEKQIKAWSKANRKMVWGIKEEEFNGIEEPPSLTEIDQNEGFIGVTLC